LLVVLLLLLLLLLLLVVVVVRQGVFHSCVTADKQRQQEVYAFSGALQRCV
jgi:hypothetical protein